MPERVMLQSARMLSDNVRLLSLHVGDAFTFTAGQWISLKIPTDSVTEPEVKRAYSIASAERALPIVEIAVTRVPDGPGSTYLHQLQPGETLLCTEAQGHFILKQPSRPILFIATGTGVAPFRSMLQSMARIDYAIVVLFGARTEADLLFRDEFERLQADSPNVRYVPTLSRGDAHWSGRRGYVQHHLREELCQLGGNADVYICGVSKMVREVRKIVREDLMIDRKQVFTERYD